MQKLKIILFGIITFWTFHLDAQDSGSGSISDYLINCMMGTPCEDHSNPKDSIIITAPEDGDLKITVTLTNGSVSCCTPSQNFSLLVTAQLYVTNNSTPIWIYPNNSTSEYTRNCVEKDDQFLLVFAGTKGNYSWTSELTPSIKTNDNEPNDVSTQSKFLAPNQEHQGRIGYGLYTRDQDDWHKIVADNTGRLKINIETDAGANFYIKNRNNLAIISTKLMPNAGMDSLVVNCVAPNDTFFLHVAARSNICAGYIINYSTIAADGNMDSEPNDDFDHATPIAVNTSFDGQIGFGFYGTDLGDYYKIEASLSGDLQIRLQFDDLINVRLYRFGNHQQFLFKLALTGGMDTLLIPCVKQGDMFFLKIEKDNPKCTNYSIQYSMTDLPMYSNDTDDNNTPGTAEELLNLPGMLSGRINYGFYENDQIDYFFLGLLEVNDKPVFDFEVDPGNITVRLERLASGTVLEKDFGPRSGMTQDSFTIATTGLYYLKITSVACASYQIKIGGTLSHVRIYGIDNMGLHSALQDIKVTNSIAGPNTLLCTREVTICPVFTVPLGHIFEVKIIQN